MLFYKDGRFHAYGVSFQIPDGFYLETCPDEQYDNGFMLYPPDRSFWVQLMVCGDCMDTQKEFEYTFSDIMSLRSQEGITPVCLDGLSGHQAIYTIWGRPYYEIRLNLPWGKELYNFVLVITTTKISILAAIEHPGVVALIDSIQKSDWITEEIM